jgi:hypothetical protein
MTDAEALYVQLPQTNVLQMIHVSDARFCLESLAIDLHFDYSRNDEATRFRYDSRMTTEVLTDTTWVRV